MKKLSSFIFVIMVFYTVPMPACCLIERIPLVIMGCDEVDEGDEDAFE
jgi:hypothetical protein